MDSKFTGVLILFFLGFTVFTGYIFFSGSFSVVTRASTENNIPSIQNSLIFAWPLSVVANGEEPTEISVFVRNQDNRGLEGKVVRIEANPPIVTASSETTDADGKAVFRLTSATSGVAEISAIVDNRKIVRTVSVEFK